MLKIVVIALVSFFFVSVFFSILLRSGHIWRLNQGQRRYKPKNGKISLFHIRDLIVRGEIELAIQMYSQLYKVGKREAIEEVEALKKSIDEKSSY